MLLQAPITTYDTLSSHLRPSVLGQAPRRPRIYRTPTKIFTFDNISDWDDVLSYCTLSGDTVNYRCSSLTGETKQSIKVTPDGSAHDYATFGAKFSAIDLTCDGKNPHFALRFYLHEGNGNSAWTTIDQIKMKIITTDGGTPSNYRWYLIYKDSAPNVHKGWNVVTMTPDDLNVTEDGTLDWSHIERIDIQIIFNGSAKTPQVTFDKLEFFSPLSKGLIMLRFDDGYNEHYDCAAYLESKGLCGSFAVIGSYENMTLDKLHKMHDAGHLIMNHTWSHPDWDLITDQEFLDDIFRMQDWMCKNGFADGSRILVTPSGRWHENGEELLAGVVDFIWTVKMCNNTYHVEPLYNPWRMRTATLTGNLTTYDDAISDANSESAVGTLLWHHIPAGNQTWAAFEADIDAIVTLRDAGNIKVITPAEILSGDYN